MFRWLVAATLLLGASPVFAGQWFIGSVSGSPGTTVSIPIWFYAEGVTSDAQLSVAFDEARLTLPVANGNIPGAPVSNGAYCTRQLSGRIGVLQLGIGNPLPVGWMQSCQIPFTIPSYAPAGKALLTGFDALCAATGGAQPCSVTSGFVNVLASGSQQSLSESPTTVAILLSADSAAPTPEMLAAVDYFHADEVPLDALRRAPPSRAYPLRPQRARGDFKQFLRENPTTASAILERYVYLDYENEEAAHAAVLAFRAERLVDYVTVMPSATEPPKQDDKALGPAIPLSKNGGNQYHLAAVQAQAAWQLAGGWSLIGVPDAGIDPTHPELQSFSGSTYLGGNHLPAYNYDFSGQGMPGMDDYNVDERQPVRTALGDDVNCLAPTSVCASDPATAGHECMQARYAGHGTHVAGLVAANTTNADPYDLQGVCRHCGLATMKVSSTVCARSSPAFATTLYQPSLVPPAITALTSVGSQVINLSSTTNLPDYYCVPPANPTHPWCATLKLIEDNDVLLVAAAGNSRIAVQFPAHDSRVVAVGGSDQTGALWDRSPGSLTSCPYYDPSRPNASDRESECGSNYTLAGGRQEVVTPSDSVRSTFYRGVNWNPTIGCGDVYGDGDISNGVGLCTGTSMSTPIASGVFGLLRSINPLAPKGDPNSGVSYGVRNVVAQTTDRALTGYAWDSKLGYGGPNTRRAADLMLGRVRGDVVTNRLTPLFTLYSPNSLDFASVASPQSAGALIRYAAAVYTTTTNPASPTTPGYASFRTEGAAPVPRANAYVLTTEFSPGSTPTPAPLYWLDRTRKWPLGCSGSPPACYPEHRDFLLVSTIADAQAAVAQGYNFRGRQGYLYPRCPGDNCMPPGTERMYRYCKSTDDDCAVFLQNQLADYQSLGYTSIFPAGSDPVMGYAYPNVDSDNDGLVDGMERIIGTALNDPDSDNDGVLDGVEFPQAGISTSDPCSALGGPNDSCTRPLNLLFANGFE